MTRWLAFAGVGALLGVAAFVFLLRRDIGLGSVFVAAGVVAAAIEWWLGRPNKTSPAHPSAARRTTRAALAFVLVGGAATITFALLFATLVAP